MFSFLSCLEMNFEALSAFPRRTSRSRDLKPWGKSCADHFHTCSHGWLHENTSDLTPLAAVLPADSVKHWLLTLWSPTTPARSSLRALANHLFLLPGFRPPEPLFWLFSGFFSIVLVWIKRPVKAYTAFWRYLEKTNIDSDLPRNQIHMKPSSICIEIRQN